MAAGVIIFLYAVLLWVMVRPNSQGPKLVSSSGSALSSVIKAGVGT
jgi:hypothetical protein